MAHQHVEVALSHPARLIANVLGPPPPDVIEAARGAGMLVAALAGKAEHARRQVASGVDIVVAQGYEACGHTGEIASMVLVPEIVDAVGREVPVLAAGGTGSGRQVAAALALGAVGVWMGSAWLVTAEYTIGAGGLRTALLNATSSDTVRSRIYSGKPARPPKNKWTEAWAEPGAPAPLPMPLQNVLVAEAHRRLIESGDPEVVPMPAGQIVGRLNEVRPVADVVADLVREAEETLRRLGRPHCRRRGGRPPEPPRKDGAVRIAVSAGYWSSGPPAGAAELFGPRTGWASTRCGPRRPTAATRGPRWPGGGRGRSTSSSAPPCPSCPPARRSRWR